MSPLNQIQEKTHATVKQDVALIGEQVADNLVIDLEERYDGQESDSGFLLVCLADAVKNIRRQSWDDSPVFLPNHGMRLS